MLHERTVVLCIDVLLFLLQYLRTMMLISNNAVESTDHESVT